MKKAIHAREKYFPKYDFKEDNLAKPVLLHWSDSVAERVLSGVISEDGTLYAQEQSRYRDPRVDRFIVCNYIKE